MFTSSRAPIVNFRHERRPEIQRLAASKGLTLSEFLRGLVDNELNRAAKIDTGAGLTRQDASRAGAKYQTAIP